VINFKKNNVIIIFLIFILILLFYCIFSTRVGLTDTAEYIDAAKEFAGLNNNNLYIYHSITYSFILGLFLRIWPSMTFLKIINSLWLVLIGFLLYKISNNKKALILWVFSPLVYYMGIFISPILAASFFLFLAYYFLKKYEDTNKIKYFIFSALSLGFSPVFRLSNLFLGILFIIIFLFNKKFNKILLYLFFCSITFLTPLFLINLYYYGIPFYSVIIYIPGQIKESIRTILPPILFILMKMRWLIPLCLVSPLWFLMFKKENKKEILFIVLSFLYLAFGINDVVHYRYLLSIAPFIILLLSKSLKKKWIVINSVISLILIIILTHNYFGNNENNILKNDLINLEKDFEEKIFVTSDGDAYFFPALYWNDFHYIWLRDYTLYKQNKTIYNNYSISSRPTIKESKVLKASVNFNQIRDPILEKVSDKDLLFIFKKDEIAEYNEKTNTLIVMWFKERIKLSNIKLIKCYNIVCVYKK